MSDCPPCPDDDCACDRGRHRLGKCSNADTGHSWGLSSEQQRSRSKPQHTDSAMRIAEKTPALQSSAPLFTPPEQWTQGDAARWQTEAYAAVIAVAEVRDTFDTSHVWRLLSCPKDKRMMVVPVRKALREGVMIEEIARRESGLYECRDGHKWPLNKLVPIYRSLLR